MNDLHEPPFEKLLQFRDVRKAYGQFFANDGLSFDVCKGQIHAIIGENGAGKTTAMKILFGLVKPTSGDILFKGSQRPWSDVQGALNHGIGMVHQHFMLSERHSALDNVILGDEFTKTLGSRLNPLSLMVRALRTTDRESALSKLNDLAGKVGFQIPWHKEVANLPVGVQQQVEIMKLLYADVDVMIFDEPTAVLSPPEKEKFLELLCELKKEGKTIILITHKLKDVERVSDMVTVLRRGKTVASCETKGLSVQDMADLMVGRSVSLEELPRKSHHSGRPLFVIENLTVESDGGRLFLDGIDLSLASGEVIGLAGVEGSGQRDLINFICGPSNYLDQKKLKAAKFSVFDIDALDYSREQMRTKRLAIIPPDRLLEAALPNEDLVENDLLGHDREFYKFRLPFGAWLDRASAKKNLLETLDRFDVRPRNPAARFGSLSGGNQQKLVIGREFSREPSLIICSEPTRGVDVGSTELIYREILKYRDEGSGILLVSSQIEELMALSDRIYVMFDGKFIKEFKRGEFDESRIGQAMGGIKF
jgi:general nucleoside transport system ATP-binding protein